MTSLISASILSADFSKLGNEIHMCEKAGVDWIHIDVMDGHFVPNLTMGPFIVETCRKITDLPLDCHLMVEKPENLIEVFAKAGASVITIHPEGNNQILQSIEKIKSFGVRAGLAINPETPVACLEPFIHVTDLFLIMTVHPGYSGQKYIPEVNQKVLKLSNLILNNNLAKIIEVDGGINSKTILETKKAGANAFVAATSIFKYPDGISAGVQALRQALV